jgi:hypothetical protein
LEHGGRGIHGRLVNMTNDRRKYPAGGTRVS